MADIDPAAAHFTVALLRTMHINTWYQVLLSVRVDAGTYRLLLYSLRAVPALCDWLAAHAVNWFDPMQLAAHRNRVDWARLDQADFEKLAANTPYFLPYQVNGGPRWA